MNIIILSLLAGVLGMGLGSLLTAVFGSRTDRAVSIFLSFAGGVMMCVVFFELIPEAVALGGLFVTFCGLTGGAIIVMLFNYVMDAVPNAGIGPQKLHETYVEFFHASGMMDSKKSLLRSGFVMLFVIALHNIPEGLAMGAAGNYSEALGLTLALIIALHNIPEGMAVSAPLISGGMSKIKAITLTTVAGATTVFGAIIGAAIGAVSGTALALCFSIAGGAMLYVVLAEIFPQSVVANKDRVPAFFAMIGIMTGMLFTNV